MKVGRRLAMKVLNASKFVLGSSAPPTPTRRWSPSRSTGPCSAGWPTTCRTATGGVRGLRLHDRARGRPSGSSGSSATTTSSWSRSGRTTTRGDGAATSARAALALRAARPAAAARAVPALRHRGGLVVVAGGLDPPARPGRPRTSSARRPTPTRALLDAVAAALVGIRGAKSQAKVSMRTPLARVEVTGPPALVEAASAAAADLRRAGHVQGDLVFTPVRRRHRDLRGRRAGGLTPDSSADPCGSPSLATRRRIGSAGRPVDERADALVVRRRQHRHDASRAADTDSSAAVAAADTRMDPQTNRGRRLAPVQSTRRAVSRGVLARRQLRRRRDGPTGRSTHEVRLSGAGSGRRPDVVVTAHGRARPRYSVRWLGVLHAGDGAVLSHLTAAREAGLRWVGPTTSSTC